MMFLYWLEGVIALLVLLFVTTQIILPIINRSKLFPMFRKEGQLYSQLRIAETEKLEAEIKKSIAKIQQKTEEISSHCEKEQN